MMALSKEEIVVRDLDCSLESLPANMRLFTVSLRTLYAENAISSSVSKDFNQLRDDIRNQALIYVDAILPRSTTLVRSLKDFFEYYIGLTYCEWVEELHTIVEEVNGYKQCCNAIVQMHESIMIPLKKSESRAKVIVSELKVLTQELKRKEDELTEQSSEKWRWAIALSFFPVINLIAPPILASHAGNDLAKAVAQGAQCDLTNAAILIVSHTMIPALSSFIDGLRAAAGFFSAIEQELISFQGRGERAQGNYKSLHYKMMRRYATNITESCTGFYAMLPDVRTDLVAIPTEDTDKNYVDVWLDKQKEDVIKKYGDSITGKVLKLFSPK